MATLPRLRDGSRAEQQQPDEEHPEEAEPGERQAVGASAEERADLSIYRSSSRRYRGLTAGVVSEIVSVTPTGSPWLSVPESGSSTGSTGWP